MELIILGSGTYQPELNRHSSSYLIKASNQNIIFDFGRGALDQLLKLDITYADIDAIFISHFHPDHSSELISFLHIALGEPNKKGCSRKAMAIDGRCRKKDLTIYGPKGINKTIQCLVKMFNINYHKLEYKIIVKELKNGDNVIGKNWQVKSYKVIHAKDLNALAYRLKSKDKTFAYSGDTTKCENLYKVLENANLAVVETSWPQEVSPETHLSGDLVGEIANKAKVKKLVLTHIAPYYLKNFNVKKDVQKNYKGKIIIAKDLMKIKN